MSIRKPRSGDRLVPGRYWRLAERSWYIVLSLGLVLVIWSAVLAGASVSSRFCGLCHGADSLQLAGSAHASISCDACHRDTTAFGLIQSRIAVIRMGFSQITPGRVTPEAYVDSRLCVGCHPETQLVQTTVSQGLLINHRGLDIETWACTRCHATVAHGDASFRVLQYDMDMCLQCHSTNPTNPATCEVCHPDGAPTGGEIVGSPEQLPSVWQVTHGPMVSRTHGMGDLATCKACHAAQFCVSCHELPLPHPPSFLKEHGPQVSAGNAGVCLSCHSKAACGNCHGLEMPHPEGILASHDDLSREVGEEACARCHEPSTCDSCHVKNTHPGLPSDVRQKLRDRPVS